MQLKPIIHRIILVPASRLILTVFLLTFGTAGADQTTASPDNRYSAVVSKDEYGGYLLTIHRGEKKLLSTPAGYGGFESPAWSQDSKYLAVVERGTKTTMNLAVYHLDGDELTQIDLPDFRLNILGRYGLIRSGRCEFDESLSWKAGPVLEFIARGNLKDQASNPTDFPNDWYEFKIKMEFDRKKASLLAVDPIKKAGKPATAPESK